MLGAKAWKCLPDARAARLLPEAVRTLPPRPDLRPRARRQADGGAGLGQRLSTVLKLVELTHGSGADIGTVDTIMRAAFDPKYGEAWTQGPVPGRDWSCRACG